MADIQKAMQGYAKKIKRRIGVDAGDTILQLRCDVSEDETADSLKTKIQDLESTAWVEVIKGWKN